MGNGRFWHCDQTSRWWPFFFYNTHGVLSSCTMSRTHPHSCQSLNPQHSGFCKQLRGLGTCRPELLMAAPLAWSQGAASACSSVRVRSQRHWRAPASSPQEASPEFRPSAAELWRDRIYRQLPATTVRHTAYNQRRFCQMPGPGKLQGKQLTTRRWGFGSVCLLLF